jgi:hypothetical protein
LKTVAPVPMNRCGTFFWLMYFTTAMLVAVPTGLTRNRTSSLSIGRRICSTVLGGL